MIKHRTPTTPLTPLPTAKGHWLLKNIPSMSRNILTHFYGQEQNLGTTYENPVPFMRIIATSEPDFMRYVLQQNHRNYEKGRAYDVLKLILGNGLVTSNGKFWQKQRRLAQPAFHKKNLEALFKVMGTTATTYFEELEQKRGTEIDIAREMMAVTAKIALKSLFSDNTEEDLNAVYDSMTAAQRYITDLMNNPLNRIIFPINGRKKQFKKDKGVLNEVVLKAIARRRQSKEKHPDLLQMMMDATYEDSNEQMNDQQLMDEMITMFSAGHETSANALATVFCLIYNAHHREDLYKNATEFNPDRFTPEKVKAMSKMNYLPFGGGPRLCIGNMFALMEMQLILVGLLQRFDFELIKTQNIDMEALVTLRPRYGIKINLI